MVFATGEEMKKCKKSMFEQFTVKTMSDLQTFNGLQPKILKFNTI